MSRWSFTYRDLLERNASLFSSMPALSTRHRSLTHGELYARGQALASGLASLGVQPGDRLAIVCENRPEMLELLAAAAWLGACLVPINYRLSADEVRYVLDDVAPRLAFVSRQYAHLVERLPAGIVQLLLNDADDPADALEALCRTTSPLGVRAWDDQAPLVVMHTAAVDGQPKGAILSHRGLVSAAMQMQATWRLGPADRGIGVLPLFHIAGLGLALAVQSAGGAVLLEERFEPDRVAELAEHQGGSVLSCFPPMLGAVLDSCERRRGQLCHLRVVSGVESPETIGRLHSMVPHAMFWSAYGQTETSGTISLSPFAERPGSAGRPMPLCSVRIVDDVGENVERGAVGQIMVRGPGVFRGYWPPAQPRPVAEQDAWHRTDDLGWLDSDGYLWFRGRSKAKDLIKTGGENVSPAEVERVLKTHPALADAAVLGIPDRTWGEAVKAVCVLRPGASATAADIIEYVGERLARFKRPKVVEFVDRVPRLTSGRVDKSAL